MASKPKRSIPRQNYWELADVKLPKGTLRDNNSKSNLSTLPGASVLYQLRVLESDKDLEKGRYIGYGSKNDKSRRLENVIQVPFLLLAQY